MLLSLLYYYDQTSATLVRKRDIFIKNKKKHLALEPPNIRMVV